MGFVFDGGKLRTVEGIVHVTYRDISHIKPRQGSVLLLCTSKWVPIRVVTKQPLTCIRCLSATFVQPSKGT